MFLTTESITGNMEKALGEMREEIGKKDSYLQNLEDLEKRWADFEPEKAALGKIFEEIDSNHHLTNPATDKIIKGTKAVKNRIKGFNTEINNCRVLYKSRGEIFNNK